MTTEFMIHLFISVAAGFFALFAIFVARRRLKKANALQAKLEEQAVKFKETVDNHTAELKKYFETKSQLVLEFKNITDKLREDNATIKKYYEEELTKLQKTYDSELGHRKSSEVRLGRISESLAPFLDGWPWDPNSFRFLGNPIDGIQFNQDELVFVEIKTGKSRLSASQKWIKDLILNGKVSFATFRITENGSNLVKENGNEG